MRILSESELRVLECYLIEHKNYLASAFSDFLMIFHEGYCRIIFNSTIVSLNRCIALESLTSSYGLSLDDRRDDFLGYEDVLNDGLELNGRVFNLPKIADYKRRRKD